MGEATLVDPINSHGRSPLMEAAILGAHDIVLSLLGASAELNLKDHEGFTALYYAVRGFHTKTGELSDVLNQSRTFQQEANA